MIVSAPNSILTTPANPVKRIDKKVLEVVSRLKKTLTEAKKPKGVGLAAPQIGVLLRIFVTRPTSSSPIEVFINPEIIWKSSKLSEITRPRKGKPSGKKEGPDCPDRKLEGCLSIHNVWGYLKRSIKVKLRYMDIKGKTQEREFSGFMATIVQHEADHLNGILFTQRVLEQKEKLYRIEKDEEGKDRLEEIEI